MLARLAREHALARQVEYIYYYLYITPGITKPDEVGDFFALVSMKLPNFCQKAKF
jgi:hypothetical protein